MDLSFLTRKMGPLPTWAWIGGGGLAGGLALRWYRSRQSSASTATAVGAGGTTAGDTSASASSPDTSGLGGTPMTTGGGSSAGSGGSFDTGTGTGTGTGFSTGPTAPPDGFTYDTNGNLIPQAQAQAGQVLDFIGNLAAQGYRYDAATGLVEPISGPAAPAGSAADTTQLSQAEALAWYKAGAVAMGYPSGDPTSTAAPSAPAATIGTAAPTLPQAPPVVDIPANTTSPAAHTTITPGAVLWTGLNAPNLQTIAASHNILPSALKVTQSGPNTTINGVTGSRYVVTYQ